MSEKKTTTSLKTKGENKRGRRKRDVQKKKSKAVERFKKCRKRRTMDWAKRFSSSNDWEIKKNKRVLKNGKRRSRKEWKCGNEILVRMDKLGEVESKLGVALR